MLPPSEDHLLIVLVDIRPGCDVKKQEVTSRGCQSHHSDSQRVLAGGLALEMRTDRKGSPSTFDI